MLFGKQNAIVANGKQLLKLNKGGLSCLYLRPSARDFLINLLFAEKEFTERNLPDDELIKVLYQIVVNREYDEGGLNYWIKEYNETYLPQANNDSFEAQKAIVMRMLYEQEFRNLCEKMGILW